jgi:diguanylate cyclase (GGDEF)-like protein
MIFKFLVPGSLVFIGTFLFVHLDMFSSLQSALVTIYPYAIFIVGLLMGWRFSRSRLIFIILVLILADRLLLGLNISQSENPQTAQMVLNILAFFIPINIMIIALIRERGILTMRGLIRIFVLGIQPVIFYVLFRFNYSHAFNFLNYRIIESGMIDKISLNQPILIIYLMAFIVTFLNFLLKQDLVEAGFFWTLLCTFFAFFYKDLPPFPTIYFSSAGLVLIISILEYSHNVAFKDELTGLPTRRSLNDTFLKLPSRYSIAMVDIDHFKKINDQHGHDVGDQVLRMVASKLQKNSGIGKAYRYGGEEFTLIYAGKTVNETRPQVEHLRKLIASAAFYIRSSKRPRKKPDDLNAVPKSRKVIPISISIGIAERDENHDTPHEVLKAADEALLRAKKAGRNRVRIFGKSTIKD